MQSSEIAFENEHVPADDVRTWQIGQNVAETCDTQGDLITRLRRWMHPLVSNLFMIPIGIF